MRRLRRNSGIFTRRINKTYLGILILIIVSFLLGFLIKNFVPLAFVNGKAIDRRVFLDRVIKRSGKQVMEGLIVERIVYDTAEKNNIEVTEKEVEDQLRVLKSGLTLRQMSLDDYLNQNMLTIDLLRKEIKLQLTIKKILKPSEKVSGKQIVEYMKENKIDKGGGAIYESQKIAIKNAIVSKRLASAFQKWITKQMRTSSIRYLIKL